MVVPSRAARQHDGHVVGRRWVAIGVAAVLVVAGGAVVWWWQRPEPAPLIAVNDPQPRIDGDGTTVGPDGATVRHGSVEVSVPAGAVPDGEEITVLPVAPLGQRLGEIFGQPAAVEHASPLRAALTLRWHVPELTQRQRDTAVLTRWDPEHEVWRLTGEPLTVDGDTLVAQVREFSFLNWVANLGQAVGELLGKRAGEPRCTGKPLHPWVRQVVDPDEDLAAAAIRVCFEPDRDEIVTARVVNNRTFTQRLRMDRGAEEWAWTWAGKEDFGPAAVPVTAARTVFDSGTSFLVPPLHEIAVGIGRPAGPGQLTITTTAEVDVVTVLLDVTSHVFSGIPIGGLENPLANAFLQAFYECGGKQLLSREFEGDVQAVVRAVVDAVTSCAGEIVRPDSEFGARFEALEQAAIRARGGIPAQVVARADRLVHQLARAYAVLRFFDVTFYLSDQLANALVGPLLFSVRGDGRPQRLGQWRPSCQDVGTDSDRLYRNLALQDTFADKSRELWEFPQWRESAGTAVAPLDACDDSYLHELADHLPGDWADAKAAAIVAERIRALTPFGNLPDGGRLRQLGICEAVCTVTGRVFFDHPNWGPSALLTTLSPEVNFRDANILVVDAAGKVRWRHRAGDWYELAPAEVPRDGTGNIFLNYNPGRYNGVIVLRPVPEGLLDFGSLPPEGDYQARFYYAVIVDRDGDGTFEIDKMSNDCDPDCAGGTISHTMFGWTGSDYAERH